MSGREGQPSDPDSKSPEETPAPEPRNVVHRARLPYPWPEGIDPIATQDPLIDLDVVRRPDALAAGSTLVVSTDVLDGEGILAFYQDRFTLFREDGRHWSVGYEGLASFKLTRGLYIRKLTLRGTDGSKVVFHMGREMAANVNYILTEKKVPSG